MAPSARETSQYRWPTPLVLRLVGRITALLGAVWILGIFVDIGTGADVGPRGYAVALIFTLALLAAALVMLWRPPLVIEVTADGYRLHHLRGGGVASARWRDVGSAKTQSTPNGPVLVIQLSDGRRSLVPLTLLGARAAEVEREIHDRLTVGHGYRPLSG